MDSAGLVERSVDGHVGLCRLNRPALRHALSPEMMDVARRAYRLRAIFKKPAAVVMPFELEIK